MLYGQVWRDVINSMGTEATLMIIKGPKVSGDEPPKAVAAAMLQVDAVIRIPERWTMMHSNARKNATAAGVRYYFFKCADEEILKKPIRPEDIHRIAERTEKIAQLLTQANTAKVSSQAGTNITMSLAGRKGIALHPLGELIASPAIPGFAEATIAPVEGTAEGAIVVDLSVTAWEHPLREPIRWTVQKGRIVDLDGPKAEVERLRELLAIDKGANVIAQLAIGTSHTIPRFLVGSGLEHSIAGLVHMAFGRNDTIGGANFSQVHIDGLFGSTTVELDDVPVVKDEELLV
jgi:leucyl aminopeptidase (aminopeptidase T)